MTATVVDILKTHVHLGSPLLMVLALAASAAWIFWRPDARGGRRFLLFVVVGYWLAATPLGAGALAGAIGYGYSSLTDAAEARGVSAIVVLGGGEESYRVAGTVLPLPSGESALRTLEAARVYKLLGRATVVVSGGRVDPGVQLVPESDILRRALVEAGVPEADILVESSSRTTREQALLVGRLLAARGVSRFVLVTSKTHMRRSVRAFRLLGFEPVPSVSPMRSEQLPRPSPLMPSGEWLRISDMALYDAAALVYYWWKGWI